MGRPIKSRDMGKWELAGAVVVFCGIGAFATFDAMDKTGWRKADAKVTGVGSLLPHEGD